MTCSLLVTQIIKTAYLESVYKVPRFSDSVTLRTGISFGFLVFGRLI